MNFLKKNPKNFYTILVDDGLCKIFHRELNSQRVVVNESIRSVYFSDLDDRIFDMNKGFVSVLQTSENQGLMGEEMIDEDLILKQDIDDGVVSYSYKDSIDDIKELLKIEISEFISPFKVLYFLSKNQKFEGTALFVMKFSQTAAFMVVGENGVKDARMLNLYDKFMRIIDSDKEAFLSDVDEMFYQTLKRYIENFYEKGDEFISSVFIYDGNESLSLEIGYYIFTRIFIKTNLMPLEILDFANKINIKENS